MYTSVCLATSSFNRLVNFAHGTVVVGLIRSNDKGPYLYEVENLVSWRQTSNLSMNVKKTKELVVEFGRI